MALWLSCFYRRGRRDSENRRQASDSCSRRWFGGAHAGAAAEGGVSAPPRVCPLCPGSTPRTGPGGASRLTLSPLQLSTPDTRAARWPISQGTRREVQAGDTSPRGTRRRGLEPRTPRLQRRRVPPMALCRRPPRSLRGDAWHAPPCRASPPRCEARVDPTLLEVPWVPCRTHSGRSACRWAVGASRNPTRSRWDPRNFLSALRPPPRNSLVKWQRGAFVPRKPR